MIVVDTSIWVDVMRHPVSRRATVFQQLLDADEVALALPVRLELMSGVARSHRAAFRRALSALPILRPIDDTWRRLEGWVEPAADRGFRCPVADLMMASLASDIEALDWSLDDDFEAMESIGLVHLYAGVRQQ